MFRVLDNAHVALMSHAMYTSIVSFHADPIRVLQPVWWVCSLNLRRCRPAIYGLLILTARSIAVRIRTAFVFVIRALLRRGVCTGTSLRYSEQHSVLWLRVGTVMIPPLSDTLSGPLAFSGPNYLRV